MDELLQEWRSLTEELEDVTRQITHDIALLKIELDNVSRPFREQLDAIESDIRAETLHFEKSREAHGVKVQYRKGYERATWDGKRLDGYAAAHPEVLAFRN